MQRTKHLDIFRWAVNRTSHAAESGLWTAKEPSHWSSASSLHTADPLLSFVSPGELLEGISCITELHTQKYLQFAEVVEPHEGTTGIFDCT